jgi:hypothetical protein
MASAFPASIDARAAWFAPSAAKHSKTAKPVRFDFDDMTLPKVPLRSPWYFYSRKLNHH